VKPLRRSGIDQTFTCKLHHACLYLVSVHQTALPLTFHSVRLIAAYYSSIDLERMKGWVGLVAADGLPTRGHPSAAGRAQDMKSSPVKDRRSIPLRHATNLTPSDYLLPYVGRIWSGVRISRIDTVHEHDGRTDGHRTTASAARMHSIARRKPVWASRLTALTR